MIAPQLRLALCLAAFGSTAAPPLPWNDSGHRIVSLLAWPQLTPAAQKGVTELLHQHPRFAEDLQLGLPADSDAEASARLAFALAANWPDTVRSASHPLHKIAHHGKWHYIDIPFVLGNQPLPAPEADPSSPGEPKDAVEAIAACTAKVADAQLPAAERAMALCWLIHLIEDIHQPLHACTLYSPQFPQGDKGGNSFAIMRNVFDPDSRTNLHSLWDALLGSYRAPAWDACVAAGLAARPELSREHLAAFLAVTDAAAWAKESHELAVEHVYLRGELKGSVSSDTATKAPLLPKDYLANAEAIAMQRAGVAAGRLADVLNRLFAK